VHDGTGITAPHQRNDNRRFDKKRFQKLTLKPSETPSFLSIVLNYSVPAHGNGDDGLV